MMDLLRDRRTLYSMIVVPILVIPGLMFGMTRAMLRSVAKAENERSPIVILGGEQAPTLAAMIGGNPRFQVVPGDVNFRQHIEDKELRLAVEFPEGFERRLQAGENGGKLAIRIYYHEDEIRSEQALRALQHLLDVYRD